MRKRWKPNRQNRRFAELTEDERIFILKIQKRLYHPETWISLTMSERVSSVQPLSRSSRHKVMILFQRKTSKVWRPNAHAKDYINVLLRTALTRWHTRQARMRNAMRSLFEFPIIDKQTVRKKTNNRFYDRVQNFFLEKIFLIYTGTSFFFLWI